MPKERDKSAERVVSRIPEQARLDSEDVIRQTSSASIPNEALAQQEAEGWRLVS